MTPAVLALLGTAPARATWASYLVFALLAVAVVAVVWHNQRARRRASRHELGAPERPPGDPPD